MLQDIDHLPPLTIVYSAESIQYLEYFKQKGQEITDLTQPLVSVSIKALDRINRTAADHSNKFIASTEPDINLVPELCSIFGLTAEIRALSKLFPSLIIHINDTRQAFRKIAVLEESLGYSINSPKLKKRVRILEAIFLFAVLTETDIHIASIQ